MQPPAFYIVDAFTQTRFAGNPAGVVLHDSSLEGEQMRRIAGELHLETAFLTPSATPAADYAVAYYTGLRRIPLCGHDTVAAAAVLRETGKLALGGSVRFATDVGVLTVTAEADGAITMEQAAPVYGAVVEHDVVAEALGVPIQSLVPGLPCQIVSTGTPFLFAPLTDRKTITSLQPDRERLIALSWQYDIPGVYAWTHDTVSPDHFIHGRCFAPAAGLDEDPVTGSASGALGAYLVRQGVTRPDSGGLVRFVTEQGYAMGRPGNARVTLGVREQEMTSVRVSGHAVIFAAGTVSV